MQIASIPTLNIICVIAEIVIIIGMTVAAILWWYKKKKVSFTPILIGAASFFLSVQVAESIFHALFLQFIPVTAKFFSSSDNFWAYVLYGSFMAGIFEETARLVCFKLMKKRYAEPVDAISYGLGHGGFECIYLVGVNMGLFLVLSIAINLGFGNELFTAIGAADKAAAETLLSGINSMTPALCLAAVFERISAMMLHVCNSVLVYRGVQTGKYWKYIIAIGTHAAFNGIALCLNQFFGIAVTEIVIFSLSAIFALYVFKIKKGEV